MGQLSLAFALIDEVVISRRSASSGGQPGLDYLPGAHLLGALAAALYRELPREDTWLMFHSGKLRFGNALPLTRDGEPAWPWPLCWHQDAAQRDEFAVDRIVNLLHTQAPTTDHLPPLAEGYISLSGGFYRPRAAFRMKSAISPDTGRLDDSGGFGYESLSEGQHFHAAITYDDDVPARVLAPLTAFFAAHPTLSFGRSRSAQYGRVACTPTAAHPAIPMQPEPGLEFSLWLLADLAACDEHGFPTLSPSGRDLGLADADLVAEKTFLRQRSYSPYNSFHGLYGTERQVLVQGSVLTYRLHQPLTAADWTAMRQRVERGLGLYRESGLGRCALAPSLLATPHPEFAPATTACAAYADPIAAPDHPLARWLLHATESGSLRGGMKQWATQALWELEQLERNARRLSGLREDQPASPARSQWGRVAEAARRAAAADSGFQTLHAELFGETSPICRLHDEDWSRPTATRDGQALTYRDWLHHKMAERPADAPSAIGLLADMAQRRLSAKR